MKFRTRFLAIGFFCLGLAPLHAQIDDTSSKDRVLQLLRNTKTNAASDAALPSTLTPDKEAKARELLRQTRIFEVRPARETGAAIAPPASPGTASARPAAPATEPPSHSPPPAVAEKLKQANNQAIAELLAKEREQQAKEQADRQKEIARIEAEILKAAEERKRRAASTTELVPPPATVAAPPVAPDSGVASPPAPATPSAAAAPSVANVPPPPDPKAQVPTQTARPSPTPAAATTTAAEPLSPSLSPLTPDDEAKSRDLLKKVDAEKSRRTAQTLIAAAQQPSPVTATSVATPDSKPVSVLTPEQEAQARELLRSKASELNTIPPRAKPASTTASTPPPVSEKAMKSHAKAERELQKKKESAAKKVAEEARAKERDAAKQRALAEAKRLQEEKRLAAEKEKADKAAKLAEAKAKEKADREQAEIAKAEAELLKAAQLRKQRENLIPSTPPSAIPIPPPATAAPPGSSLTPEAEARARAVLIQNATQLEMAKTAAPASLPPPRLTQKDIEADAKARREQARKTAQEAKARQREDARQQAEVEAQRREQAKAERQTKGEPKTAAKPGEETAAESTERGTLPWTSGAGKSKAQRLAELLDAYRRDIIGPPEYHRERARILAEPAKE